MKRTLCAATMLLATTSVWSAVDVGWIESISGNAKDVRILRQGKIIEAAQFLPIQEGDNVTVVAGGTAVAITLGNGQKLTADNAHPLTATRSGAVPSVAGNLMGWIASLGKKESRGQTMVITSSRGADSAEKLAIPLLRNDNMLVAGDRPLALAWQGGKPPYSVKLLRRDTQKEAGSFAGIQQTHLVETIHITQGIYEIVLSDAAGATWREKLIAVANRTLPNAPAELDRLPEQIRTAVAAGWLAGIDDGLWVLEAYTQIVTRPQLQEADRVVMKALQDGEAPGEQ